MAKDKPYYPLAPIGSLAVLAKTLGVHPKILHDLAEKASVSYTHFVIETKGGKMRDVYEPKYELKNFRKELTQDFLRKFDIPITCKVGLRMKLIQEIILKIVVCTLVLNL